MTDNVENTPAVTAPDAAPASAAAASTDSKKASKPTQQKKPKKASSVVAIIALLLVILSLIAVGGIAWKGYELSQQVANLDQALKTNSDSKVALDQQLANVEQQTRLQNKLLKQNAERIAQLPGADRNDWLLAEAEYLLRLANQRLGLENDVQGSLAILAAADNVLAQAENPLLLPVRRLIAKEIQSLRTVPAVDMTGAVARLQALQDQIKTLEWMPRTLPKTMAKVEEENHETVQDPFQKFLNKAWAGIGAFIRIREHDKELPAPLTPAQHYYLQQNMNLMLEQAQVALVRQQSVLYKQSIERTQQWMDEFVIAESADTAAVKETLAELSQWEVSPVLPEISGSLSALRKLLDQQRHSSAPAPSQATQ